MSPGRPNCHNIFSLRSASMRQECAYYRVANIVNEGFDLIQISQLRLAREDGGGLSMLPGGNFAPSLMCLRDAA